MSRKITELLNSNLQSSLSDQAMSALTAFREEADSRNLLSLLDIKRGQVFVLGDDVLPNIRFVVDMANSRAYLEAEICVFPTTVADEVDALITHTNVLLSHGRCYQEDNQIFYEAYIEGISDDSYEEVDLMAGLMMSCFEEDHDVVDALWVKVSELPRPTCPRAS